MNKEVVMGLLAVAILGGLLGWAVASSRPMAPPPPTLSSGPGNVTSLEFRTVRLRVNGCDAGDIDVIPATLNIRRGQRVAWIVPGMTNEDYRWTIKPTSSTSGGKTPPDDYFNSGQPMSIEGASSGISNNAYFTNAPQNLPSSPQCNPCEWDYDVVVEQWDTSSNAYVPCTEKDPKIRIRD